MRIAYNSLTALRVLRSARQERGRVRGTACDLTKPDLSPRTRLTAGILPLERLALDEAPSAQRPVHVAVPSAADRLEATFARCTVYGSGLPAGAFLDLGDGVVVASPELVFLEMARVMDPATHALLGYELCGSFARDARDARCGDVRYGVEPATSAARIERFLDKCGRVRGKSEARRALARVRDNAWSPMEAVLALMLVLPVREHGYGLSGVELNVRHEASPELVRRGVTRSRVPDIELAGTSVGFNYDGRGHLDLDSIAGAEPGDASAAAARVRERYVDDLKRNRELAAQGRLVLPVVSEDLFNVGALDTLVLEAMLAAEARGERSADDLRALLDSWPHAAMRQTLLRSLLPWRDAARYARELRGSKIVDGMLVYEEDIEFPV